MLTPISPVDLILFMFYLCRFNSMDQNKKEEKKKQKKKDPVTNFTSLLPEGVRNMKELNRDMFTVSAVFPCIKCRPISCGKISSMFRHQLINRSNFKRIRDDRDSVEKSKIILLRPDIRSLDEFTTSQKSILDEEGATFTRHEIELTYKDFNLEEILKKVLPKNTEELVSSFETVGHIAHVNLKENLLDFKHLIGTLLLDKNPNIKTVVNKTNSIEETFRFFKMELLAGEDDMYATVQEHGCVFKFDYSTVYWNSRLQTEHQRIVEILNPNDVVFDVFAGVGPFAVPAAKKKCVVYANDLNKFSYKALVHNAELNKVSENVKCFNMDGREFLNQVICKELCSISHNVTKHIVMNLPALAPTFLDVFKEKYDNFDIPLTQCNKIFVHCYCFCKSKTPQEDAEVLVSESIGLDISTNVKTHLVRRVAPNKVMMCVSFKLFWFEPNASKCTCEESVTLVTRKRLIEGGCYSIVAEKSKRLDS
ncbi:tRNA (guanine(37)-N1)-methyltransferase-like [Hydractinia symbiolongicarpus]|uniref:tRNA (guanine(37)-N1)-methyltransferase-like n=1 Tax=Hydractinia symbiolongicarpus TaxID=13093 RepID=UPI00254D514A|nr:tRNA (guanine(37)-N1)-methyltransferase-like [Hydractinia symbiolongicarpus]